ncbi:MAG: hypothetical protein ABIH03_12780, partial [Pseudomonadota bacterium]
ASRLMVKAIGAGDEEAAVQAQEIRDNAQREAWEIDNFERAMAARERTAPRRQQGLTPAAQTHVEQFQDDHPWYDPKGTDEDSQLVVSLDNQVMAAGFRPETKAYWDELERRMQKYLPHRFDEEEDEDASARQPKGGNGAHRQTQPGSKRGPQLGSGRAGAGGSVTVYVSPERKAAMVQVGAWDDPEKRNAILRRYADYDREHGKPAR